MTIFCSKKLETFLGTVNKTTQSAPSTVFGDWNGHLFTLDRKKCLILTSNRTGYTLVTTQVLKKGLKDFGDIFRERLIRQLNYDFCLNEQQEIKLRNEMTDIVLCKSNGDRRIITTINHLAEDLKYNDFGDIWDDLRATRILNGRPLGTKLPITNRKFKDFFVPVDVVRELIK